MALVFALYSYVPTAAAETGTGFRNARSSSLVVIIWYVPSLDPCSADWASAVKRITDVGNSDTMLAARSLWLCVDEFRSASCALDCSHDLYDHSRDRQCEFFTMTARSVISERSKPTFLGSTQFTNRRSTTPSLHTGYTQRLRRVGMTLRATSSPALLQCIPHRCTRTLGTSFISSMRRRFSRASQSSLQFQSTFSTATGPPFASGRRLQNG